jgi:hypothetical protein
MLVFTLSRYSELARSRARDSSVGRGISQVDQQDWRSLWPIDLSRTIVLRGKLVVDGAPRRRVISVGELEADDRRAVLARHDLGPWLQGVNLRHG